MTVGSPIWLWAATIAAAVVVALGWRGPRRRAFTLGIATFALLAAAADVRISLRRRPVVAVLVDASASTRDAPFRDAALVRQIASRLAPDATLRFETFADDRVGSLPQIGGVADASSTRTTLPTSVEADAVLLFSDGRFTPDESWEPGRPRPDLRPDRGGDAPALTAAVEVATPIFPVLVGDDDRPDARIVSTTHRDGRLVVAVDNRGRPRTLTWPDGTRVDVPTGSTVLARHGPETRATVSLDAGDAWPENDAVTVGPPPRAFASERWWVGPGEVPAGYRRVDLSSVMADDWLAASAVVLNDVAADEVSADARRSLDRYVRDLGGALVIVGGDAAFSAGGYGGTELDDLSPLMSRPPESRRTWVVLVDASGSMAKAAEDGRPRLSHAVDAAIAAIDATPSTDAIAAGTFARAVSWWEVPRPLPLGEGRGEGPRRREDALNGIARPYPNPLPGEEGTRRPRPTPPADIRAGGPTNLRAAIESAIADGGPRRVLVLTDGEADLGDVDALADAARRADATIDWVSLDHETARTAGTPLARLVASTGGRVVAAGDAVAWPDVAARAVRAAERVPAESGPVSVLWDDASPPVAATDVNRVFARDGVEALARRVTRGPDESRAVPGPPGSGRGRPGSRHVRDDDDDVVVAARWRVGLGRVAAIAYAAPAAVAARVGESVASSPLDARFVVRWAEDRVVVEARDDAGSMNGLTVRLARHASTSDDARRSERDAWRRGYADPIFEQIAPGRYEAALPRSPTPSVATVAIDGRVVDAAAVAGVGPLEFDGVGVDRDALDQLAARTGGRTVDLRDAEGRRAIVARARTSVTPALIGIGLAGALAALIESRARR